MRAKRFFFVSVGILALAAAYHLGASTAVAQAPSNSVLAAEGSCGPHVYTANGDVYMPSGGNPAGTWSRVANIFSSPTPVTTTTFGALKAKYR